MCSEDESSTQKTFGINVSKLKVKLDLAFIKALNFERIPFVSSKKKPTIIIHGILISAAASDYWRRKHPEYRSPFPIATTDERDYELAYFTPVYKTYQNRKVKKERFLRAKLFRPAFTRMQDDEVVNSTTESSAQSVNLEEKQNRRKYNPKGLRC